jgi:signal transduction histidine kinase
LGRDKAEQRRTTDESLGLERREADDALAGEHAFVETELGAARERFRRLVESGALIASSLDYETTLTNLARSAVPVLGRFCIVDVIEEDRTVRRLVVVAADPRETTLARELEAFVPDLRAPEGMAKVVRTGKPIIVNDFDPEPLAIPTGSLWPTISDRRYLEILRQLGLRSVMIVPMQARGRTLGTMSFESTRSGRYGASELVHGEALARLGALAVDNARVYAVAQRAVRARDDLLAVVSHDLRSPLNVIALGVGALANRSLGEDAVERTLDRIRRSVDRANHLIEQLLSTASIEAGFFTIRKGPHRLGGLVRDGVEAAIPLAAERAVVLEPCVTDEDTVVSCDRERVLQVFENLIGNAIKFAPAATTIRIAARAKGREVEISVRDTGPGIPEESLRRIWDRYWQGGEGDARGAGLGLFVAKGIVNCHGGRIWAESEPGKGSTFTFTLPRA